MRPDSVPTAVIEAVTLERCARIHLLAEAAGGTELVPAEVDAGRRAFRPHYLRHMWEANRARVLDAEPALAAASAAVEASAGPPDSVT